MNQIRKRLTYANVMSSLAVFLVLGGATAFAAGHLGKNTVGTKQLKKNAVTTAKIKKNAVNGAKIKAGSVNGAKLANGAVSTDKLGDAAVTEGKLANGAVGADKLANGAVNADKLANNAVNTDKLANDSVTGAKINAGSTPFSQVVDRIRGTAQIPAVSGAVYPFNNATYTQKAGVDNQYLGAADVRFAATCNPPRNVALLLLVDPVNPAAPSPSDLAGYGVAYDNAAGTATDRLEWVPYLGGPGMTKLAPGQDTQHTFYAYVNGASCSSGSGITIVGAGVDVIGTE